MDIDEEQDVHKLRFNQFDLASVLQHGKLLLGSAGKEYDIDFSDMTPQERLELQRRNLKERLGLASQFMDGMSILSFFLSSFFFFVLI
jgi:TATA-binding protein-associated factor